MIHENQMLIKHDGMKPEEFAQLVDFLASDENKVPCQGLMPDSEMFYLPNGGRSDVLTFAHLVRAEDDGRHVTLEVNLVFSIQVKLSPREGDWHWARRRIPQSYFNALIFLLQGQTE